MEQRDFWKHLEYRVCEELFTIRDDDVRGNWCDGLLPETFDLDSSPPTIRGRAWVGKDGQGEWKFELILRDAPVSLDAIDWGDLIPKPEDTYWLALDVGQKRMLIDMATARPA